MSLRVLGYETRIWERHWRQHPGELLPPIVPIVISQDPSGWSASMDFVQLIPASTREHPVLRAVTPSFQYIRRARDALARRALNVVVVVLMGWVIVAAKPLSSDHGSISLSNLRVLGHEIAVGSAFPDRHTPAREGANVLPSARARAV